MCWVYKRIKMCKFRIYLCFNFRFEVSFRQTFKLLNKPLHLDSRLGLTCSSQIRLENSTTFVFLMFSEIQLFISPSYLEHRQDTQWIPCMFLVWWSYSSLILTNWRQLCIPEQPSVLCICKRDAGQTHASCGCTLTITSKAKLRRVHSLPLHALHQKPNFTVNNENREHFSSVSWSLCLARGLQWLKTKKISFGGKSINF